MKNVRKVLSKVLFTKKIFFFDKAMERRPKVKAAFNMMYRIDECNYRVLDIERKRLWDMWHRTAQATENFPT